MPLPEQPRTGRPRDPDIDDRVLETTRRLLVESGWEATTVRGIAVTAGVPRSSVLRRWPTKTALVLEAVLGATPDLRPFEGTDRAGWVRWVAEGSVEVFSRPEVRAALPGLLGALREQPELGEALWRTFTAGAVELYGGADPVTAQAVIVLAAGAALFADALPGTDDTPALRRRIEEILLAGTGVSEV